MKRFRANRRLRVVAGFEIPERATDQQILQSHPAPDDPDHRHQNGHPREIDLEQQSENLP